MNDHKTAINISISRKLLTKIEKNVTGESRSEKITKCAELGYRLLTNQA